MSEFKIPYIHVNDTVTIFLKNRPYTFSSSSPQYSKIMDALKRRASEEEFEALVDLNKCLNVYSGGNIEIRDGKIYYKKTKEVLHHVLVSRIFKFMQNDLPWEPLAKFMDKLFNNPSKHTIDNLYRFLEYQHLAITPDGNFRAYKAVRNDWYDIYSGKFLNTIGSRLSMPRNAVCDDPTIGCSYGFHVGTLNYVRNFAHNYGEPGGDRIIIVEVDPGDVVSVPNDYDCQKVRVCAYTVIAEYSGPLPEYSGEHISLNKEEDDNDNFYSVDDDFSEEAHNENTKSEEGKKEIVAVGKDDNVIKVIKDHDANAIKIVFEPPSDTKSIEFTFKQD